MISKNFFMIHSRNLSYFQESPLICPQATAKDIKNISSPWLMTTEKTMTPSITNTKALVLVAFNSSMSPHFIDKNTTIDANFARKNYHFHQFFDPTKIQQLWHNISPAVIHNQPMALMMTSISLSQYTKMLSTLSNKTV